MRSDILLSTIPQLVGVTASLALSFYIILGSGHEKTGLFSIHHPDVVPRGVPIPIPESIPTSNLAGLATGAISEVRSVATSVIGEASSAVKSAASAGESFLAQKIPQNISLGTKYVCVSYSGSSDCRQLPDRGDDLIIDASLPSLKSMPSYLSLIILGMLFTFLSAISSVPFIPFAHCILIPSSLLGLFFYLVPAGYTWAAIRAATTLAKAIGAEVRTGPVYPAITAILICSLIGVGLAILRFLL